MSAITETSTPTARPLTRRLWNVIRLHSANPFTILGTPLLVMGLIFVINWVIWLLVRINTPNDPESVMDVSIGFQYSGASLWAFVYMMVVAIMAMNLTFSFALGFGSTRRDFSLGTAGAFIALSAFYALLYTGLALLEKATNGWGVGGAMFNSFYFGVDGNWGVRLFNVFAAFLFFFAIGSVFGAIYVRSRARGLILFFAVLSLVLLGLVVLLTLTESWGALGDFFVTVGFFGAYALSLIVSAVAGVAGYLVLQRATPRS
jgi:hypothetical protein